MDQVNMSVVDRRTLQFFSSDEGRPFPLRRLAKIAGHVWKYYWKIEGLPEAKLGSVGLRYRGNLKVIVEIDLRKDLFGTVHNDCFSRIDLYETTKTPPRWYTVLKLPAMFQAILEDDLRSLRSIITHEDITAMGQTFTPLEYALMLGNVECARHLLDRFGTRNVPVDKLLRSTLCCEFGNVHGCLDLLFSLPDVEETLTNDDVLVAFRAAYHEQSVFERVVELAGWTTSLPESEVPQQAFLLSRTVQGTRLLMDLGVDPNENVYNPWVNLRRNVSKSLFLFWVEHGNSNLDVARAMLEGGAKPHHGHARRVYRGEEIDVETPMFTCCTAKKDLEMFKLLLEYVDFNLEGYRCMLDCLSHPDWLAALIEAGAPVNYEDGIPPPLEKAFDKRLPKAVVMLIEAGADPDVKVVKRTALKIAAENGWSGVLKLLLDRNFDSSDRGSRVRREAALVQACKKGHFECAKLLVEAGVAIPRTAAGGSTLLHMASASGFLEIVELLLENGAKVDAMDSGGRTPLIAAAAALVIGIDYTPSSDEEDEEPPAGTAAPASIVPATGMNSWQARAQIRQRRQQERQERWQARRQEADERRRKRQEARKAKAEAKLRKLTEAEGEDDEEGEEEEEFEEMVALDVKKAILQALLDAGADPEHMDDDDMTAYHHAREALDEESCELLET